MTKEEKRKRKRQMIDVLSEASRREESNVKSRKSLEKTKRDALKEAFAIAKSKRKK